MDLPKVPPVLKGAAQWVCWRVERRDGKPTKVPLDPETGEYASVADPATWRDVETALTQYQRVADVAGIGFVFREEGPFAGVDLDDCRDPETGAVDEWAVEIVRQLASYTEVSPSGTGLHVIVKGRVPAGGNRRGDLEMYDRDRYFTVTGDRVPGAPTTVEDRVTELQAIHEKHITADEGTADADAAGVEQQSQVPVADDALIEKAKNAANGEKFRALWNGETAGYPSHSEADLALCSLLAFWTRGDPARMKRLFAQSGLVRDKWRSRADYRERTIRTAIRGCNKFYDPGDDNDTV